MTRAFSSWRRKEPFSKQSFLFPRRADQVRLAGDVLSMPGQSFHATKLLLFSQSKLPCRSSSSQSRAKTSPVYDLSKKWRLSVVLRWRQGSTVGSQGTYTFLQI